MLPQELAPIYNKYNQVLKPLIAEFESQSETIADVALINLPIVFDNIAIYVESASKGINNKSNLEFLKEANKELDSVIHLMHIHLTAIFLKNSSIFKDRFPEELRRPLDSGKFNNAYKELEKTVRSCKSTSDYKGAYQASKQMQQMVDKFHADHLLLLTLRESKWLTLSKWIISIFISVLFGAMFS